MSVRIAELARHDTRSLTRAVRNDIALLKECEVHACVAAINMAPLTGCRCLLRSRAINMSLLGSEEQAKTIRFHLRPPRVSEPSPALRDFLMAHPAVMESFESIPTCRPGHDLPEERSICLKNETKAEAARTICLHSFRSAMFIAPARTIFSHSFRSAMSPVFNRRTRTRIPL